MSDTVTVNSLKPSQGIYFARYTPWSKHHLCQCCFNLRLNLNLVCILIFYHHPLLIMVQTKSNLENHSKEKHIEQLNLVDDISTKLSDLSSQFDYFLSRSEVLS